MASRTSGNSEGADRKSIENVLSQVKEQVKAAETHGRPIKRVTIVTNFVVLEEEESNTVLGARAYRDFVKKYKVEVLDVGAFEQVLIDEYGA